jgi:hypothetical protein
MPFPPVGRSRYFLPTTPDRRNSASTVRFSGVRMLEKPLKLSHFVPFCPTLD